MLSEFLHDGSFILIYFVLFYLAKTIKEQITQYKIYKQIIDENNYAVAVALSGYLFSVAIIFTGAYLGPSKGYYADIMSVTLYSLLGIVFLNLSTFFNDKLILRKFCNTKKLIDEKNLSVGVIEASTYIATGLIVAGSITGAGGGWVTAVVFFILGQLSLLLFTIIYDWLLKYSIHDEVENDNTSAAISLSGMLIALGIIISDAVAGDFVSWFDSISSFLVYNIIALIGLFLVRIIINNIVMNSYELDHEVSKDHNIGAGILQAVVLVSFAIVIKVIL